MSSNLTSAEKKYLRGQAQTLAASVHIGKNGLTPAIFGEIELALEKHQLVKIQFHLDREALVEATSIIEEQNRCTCVGQIGKTASFFRASANTDDDADD